MRYQLQIMNMIYSTEQGRKDGLEIIHDVPDHDHFLSTNRQSDPSEDGFAVPEVFEMESVLISRPSLALQVLLEKSHRRI